MTTCKCGHNEDDHREGVFECGASIIHQEAEFFCGCEDFEPAEPSTEGTQPEVLRGYSIGNTVSADWNSPLPAESSVPLNGIDRAIAASKELDRTIEGLQTVAISKARHAPVAQVDASMKQYITKPQSEVIKEMVPVWEKAFTEACEALAKCGAEFCRHERREHKDSCGCLHPGCECDTFIPAPAVAQVDAGKCERCGKEIERRELPNYPDLWMHVKRADYLACGSMFTKPAVAQTELPPIPDEFRIMHTACQMRTGSSLAPVTSAGVIQIIERIAKSEAREAELKAEIAKMQMDNVIDYKAACEQHAANYEALERSHKALLEALKTYSWRFRSQFPNDPSCVICGAGYKWSKDYGHNEKCPIAAAEKL